MAGHAHTLPQAAAAAIGGGTALVTHLIKTGVRMGVNTSPEPFSNIIVSLVENLTVAGMVVFALLHPVPAALIAGVAADRRRDAGDLPGLADPQVLASSPERRRAQAGSRDQAIRRQP